jgi:hypothetical protein
MPSVKKLKKSIKNAPNFLKYPFYFVFYFAIPLIISLGIKSDYEASNPPKSLGIKILDFPIFIVVGFLVYFMLIGFLGFFLSIVMFAFILIGDFLKELITDDEDDDSTGLTKIETIKKSKNGAETSLSIDDYPTYLDE